MPYAPDLTGSVLDARYELHDLIGEGTFGRVYRGRDRRLARDVAIKVIKPWWSEDPEWVHNFEREAQLLARVNDPGIVQIFDVGHASEGLYYVAELVDGESLASRLRRGPLAPRDACDIAEQLCRALDHAHAQRVVHRDIKPENVLISTRGRVKVGDFGVARLAEGSTAGDAPAAVVGTPRYMAPEQAQGGPTTLATDVYSVGVVLYEMLAGQPPFSGASAVELAVSHLHDAPPPLPAPVPRALNRIVETALAKRPEDRYETAGAMADALALAGARPSRPPSERAPERATDREHPPPTANSNGHASPPLPSTRVAPQMSPRRNVNPSARRRSIAAIACVLLLLAAMGAAALLLGSDSTTRVPNLRGLSRSAVRAATAKAKLGVRFRSRYDPAPRGTVIAQAPAAGAKVKQGVTVRAVLSAGLAPVPVPTLTGRTASAAQALLARLGLSASALAVPAPGTTPGIVVRQSPAAGIRAPAHSKVTLSVAEQPRWRTLTSFAGQGSGQSVPFKIRGVRWRVLYSMQYGGTCTFVIFCSGPTAHVVSLDGRHHDTSFDLSNGGGQTQSFDAVATATTTAGLYQIKITPGSDTARWSMQVQDYY